MNDLDFISRLGIKDSKQAATLNNLHLKTTERTRDKPKFKSPIVEGIVHQVDLIEMPNGQ